MRGVDHKRIAYAIASVVSRYSTDAVMVNLERGSLYPDRYHKRRAHHRGRIEDIKNYILLARQYFIENNIERSAFIFGIASHYIADATCPGSENHSEHYSWERQISEVRLPNRIVPETFRTPNDILNIVNGLKRKASPQSSFRTSLYMCSGILDLTWRQPSEKTNIEEKLIEMIRQKMPSDKYIHQRWFLAIISCIGITILTSLIGILTFGIITNLIILGITYSDIQSKKSPYIWILKWYGLKK